MRLLRLEVQDLRRYTGPPRVVMFDPRGTVLHGPNEAGKSTLFEALRRVLFDRSRTHAGWVERLIPYGSRAIPSVRLDFEHGGRTLRIEKRFGAKGEAALLERRPGSDWTTSARNEEAEEMLLTVLGATASGARDGAPRENWGAFQWLLVPQDLRGLPDEKADAASHLGLDSAGVSDAFEAVRRLLQEQLDRTYTTTRRISGQSELAAVEKRVEQLDAERADLDKEIARLAEMRRRHDERVEDLPRIRDDVAQAKREWDAAQDEAEGLLAAQGEHEAATEALRGAEERARTAAGVLRDRVRLEKSAAAAESAREAAVVEEVKTKEQSDRITRLWTEAREEAGHRGSEAAALRRRSIDAERCLSVRTARRDVEALREVHRRATEADVTVATARAAIGEDPPKPALVTRVQKLESEARERRASARVASLTVTVEGNPGLRITADGTAVTGTEAIALDAVVVEAKGGRVTVRGDTAEAQRLADEARDLEHQLDELLAPFGVNTVEDLRTLREDRLRKRAELDAALREREAIDVRPTDELAAEIPRLVALADEAERARVEAGADRAHDGMVDAELRAAVRQLAGEVRDADQAFEEARKTRERRNGEYDRFREAHGEAAKARARAESTATNAAAELDRHRDAYGSTDRCREADAKAREAHESVIAREAQASANVERISRDAETRRKSARQKYVRLDEAVRTAEAEVRQLAETLDHESVRGAYSRLGSVERSLEVERARRDRLSLAARAALHLSTVMEGVRSEVVQRVVAPIKSDLDDLLAAATSGRYTLADLDNALRPGTLAGAAGVRCDFEDGSQGLRELVGTLIRVAVAAHLSRSEPQTVILDDPCVHVSRERTARLVDILNERTASSRIQVVVLTHRQNEFLGLIGTDLDVAAL